MAREKICGIYKIENKINGKVYIGQSNDIYQRWNEHRSRLRRNVHPNQHLCAAWTYYQEENFQFSILEQCVDITKCNEREQYWIQIYNSTNNLYGYNATYGGDGVEGLFDIDPTRYRPIVCLTTGEKFERIYDACNKYNMLYSSINSCANKKNRYTLLASGQKLVWRYYDEYITMSPEEIQLALEDTAIHYISIPLICLTTLQMFDSIQDAVKQFNISSSNISACIAGKTKYAGVDENNRPLVWMKLEDYQELTNDEKERRIMAAQSLTVARRRPIVLINTGEVFSAIKEAARKFHISSENIALCCRNKRDSAGKHPETGEPLRWAYYDEYLAAN